MSQNGGVQGVNVVRQDQNPPFLCVGNDANCNRKMRYLTLDG